MYQSALKFFLFGVLPFVSTEQSALEELNFPNFDVNYTTIKTMN